MLSAPASGMNAAPAIGIQACLIATAGPSETAKSTPTLGDSSGEVFGWTDILKALGINSQVVAAGTTAAREPSCGHDLNAMTDLRGATPQVVSLDQPGSNVSAASKPPAPGGLLGGTRTVVAAITPKTIDRSGNIANDSFRGRKLRSHSEEPAKQKSETASVGEMSTVPVPPPEVSQPVLPAADAGYVRTHSSSPTSQHTHHDAS